MTLLFDVTLSIGGSDVEDIYVLLGIRRSSVGTEVGEAKTGRSLPVGQFPLEHISVRVFSGGVYCRRPKPRLMSLNRVFFFLCLGPLSLPFGELTFDN